jgi:hypothetical protein
VAFGLALAPSLLLLTYWKWSGLGDLPAFAAEQARVAAGAGTVAVDIDFGRYLELDLEHWREQMGQLREFFWSARLAQWAPFAGLFAVLRVRRGAVAGLLAGWLGAFLLVKGFSTKASIEGNSFWRLLMPAWPAYLLLFASIPLLVPTLASRLGERLRAPATLPASRRLLAAIAVLALAVPAIAIAASSPTETPERAVYQDDAGNFILTPVDDGIEVTTRRDGAAQVVTWTSGSWRADVFYRVYRTTGAGPDTDCEHSDGARAAYCYLRSTPIATTRAPSFVDTAPPAEGAVYRIGVGANWLDDPEQGDIFAFSPPVSATP